MRRNEVDTNKLPDLMPRVARMLEVSGVTIQDVVNELRTTDLSESSIYYTIKGAAMCYPHVKQALEEACIQAAIGEKLPDTERG
jgi:hypothetical protein